jgi:hypothetical protein
MITVNEAVLLSGLVQITFAVMLGWPVLAFRFGWKSVGPFKHAHRLLQAHIDNIMMAMLQIALAAAVPGIGMLAGVLLLIGSWVNPQLFLMAATVEGGRNQSKSTKPLAYFSFSTLTIAYPLILWGKVIEFF